MQSETSLLYTAKLYGKIKKMHLVFLSTIKTDLAYASTYQPRFMFYLIFVNIFYVFVLSASVFSCFFRLRLNISIIEIEFKAKTKESSFIQNDPFNTCIIRIHYSIVRWQCNICRIH